MSKTCPTCGANWDDERHFQLPTGHPQKGNPHRCPICSGSGLVTCGFYGSIGGAAIDTLPQSCRGCNGTGIVWG